MLNIGFWGGGGIVIKMFRPYCKFHMNYLMVTNLKQMCRRSLDRTAPHTPLCTCSYSPCPTAPGHTWGALCWHSPHDLFLPQCLGAPLPHLGPPRTNSVPSPHGFLCQIPYLQIQF